MAATARVSRTSSTGNATHVGGLNSSALARAPVVAPTKAVARAALRMSSPARAAPVSPSWWASRVARSRTGMCGTMSIAVSASHLPPATAPAPARRIDDTANRASREAAVRSNCPAAAFPMASGSWCSLIGSCLLHASLHYLCAGAAGGRHRAAGAGGAARGRLRVARPDGRAADHGTGDIDELDGGHVDHGAPGGAAGARSPPHPRPGLPLDHGGGGRPGRRARGRPPPASVAPLARWPSAGLRRLSRPDEPGKLVGGERLGEAVALGVAAAEAAKLCQLTVGLDA